MTKEKTFMEQMLFKYPNMNRVSNCSICMCDLRYDSKIHRIDMEWYCDKCYKKYKKSNTLKEIFINQSKDFTKIVDDLNYDQRKYLIMILHIRR